MSELRSVRSMVDPAERGAFSLRSAGDPILMRNF